MGYSYLVVSEGFDQASHADILCINQYLKTNEKLLGKLKDGIGIEITINYARKLNPHDMASWIAGAQELYRLCHYSGFQFIMSSGASLPVNTVSWQSFEALLKVIGIEPERYWTELDKWMLSRLERRVRIS